MHAVMAAVQLPKKLEIYIPVELKLHIVIVDTPLAQKIVTNVTTLTGLLMHLMK